MRKSKGWTGKREGGDSGAHLHELDTVLSPYSVVLRVDTRHQLWHDGWWIQIRKHRFTAQRANHEGHCAVRLTKFDWELGREKETNGRVSCAAGTASYRQIRLTNARPCVSMFSVILKCPSGLADTASLVKVYAYVSVF